MKLSFTTLRPHLISIAAFALITILYFLSAFQGKVIKQHDMLMAQGAAKEVADHRERTGEEPLWTNSMFGGMPAYQIAIDSPANLIKPITIFFAKVFTVNGAIIFLCMAGFYVLLLVMKQSPFVSAIGAIAFGLSAYHVGLIQAGHITKGLAIAYMAPVIAGVLLAYRGKLLAGGALTAMALALQLSANHLQITYYLVFIVLFIGVAQFISALLDKQLFQFSKASAVLIASSILAVGPGATLILSTMEYGKETTRGKSELTINAENKTTGLDRDYAVQYSYGKSETFSWLVPNYKGGGSGAIAQSHKELIDKNDSPYKQYVAQMDSYWGDQPYLSGPVYVGAIVIFLFVLSLFMLRGPLKWALLCVTVLAILLAWGKNLGHTDPNGDLVMPLTDFFLDHIPGYNKFRAVSMMLVVVELSIPLLAFIALGKIIEDPSTLQKNKLPLWIALGSTAGLCILFYLAPTMFQNFYKEGEVKMMEEQLLRSQFPQEQITIFLNDLRDVRIQIFKQDVLRSMLFILAAGALIYFYIQKKLKSVIVLPVIGLLVLVDMWTVDKRYLNKEDFISKASSEKPFRPSLADSEILRDKAHYRVLNLTSDVFSDATTSYFHKSVGGYHGAKLKRYQEFIEHYLSKSIQDILASLRAGTSDSAISLALAAQSPLNLLNTKYLIYDPAGPPLVNKSAYGNAWFVDEFVLASNADEEFASLEKLDLRKSAVIDKRYSDVISDLKITPGSSSSIKLTSYAPNKLTYKANTRTEQLVIFSEIYYPYGWNAYLDEEPVQHIRANYLLRAMKVPAGEHKIEFRFEPGVYKIGERVALLSSILLILFALIAVIQEGGWLARKGN